MRTAFHQDLDQLTDQLIELTHLAGSALARATTALLDADVMLAETVIAADREIDRLREELDLQSIDLLARQQPVATDLRFVVTSMRMSAARDVEAARGIERDDDAMDDLHRSLVERISSPAWPHGTETAVDMTLISRYYERFADHAVSVAHRVIFLVTGQYGPEAEASHEDEEDDTRPFPSHH